MPNTRSAMKQLRQRDRRQFRNRRFASQVKSQIKKTETVMASADVEAAKKEFLKMARTLDKVAGKKIIHKNRAARKKSRLHKRLAALLARGGSASSAAPPVPKAEN